MVFIWHDFELHSQEKGEVFFFLSNKYLFGITKDRVGFGKRHFIHNGPNI